MRPRSAPPTFARCPSCALHAHDASSPCRLDEQAASLQQPHLWRGRALAAYLGSDLMLRAIAVCAVVSSWIDSSPTRQRETGAALLFGAVVFLLVSGALFPSGRESHGYVQVSGLRQSQQVGLALSLYSALFAPMTALILHFGSYALLELVASTSLAVGITLLYLPSLVPSFLGGVGLTLLLFALAAAKVRSTSRLARTPRPGLGPPLRACFADLAPFFPPCQSLAHLPPSPTPCTRSSTSSTNSSGRPSPQRALS